MTGSAGAAAPRRTEREIFQELAAVCTSQGYSHAIAYLCFRDNIVRYAGEINGRGHGTHVFDEASVAH